MPNNLIPFGTALIEIGKLFVGAFAGAWCAFQFERKKRTTEEFEEQFRACKYAQFAIMSQLNTLLLIRKQQLNPQRDNKNRWAELHPVLFEDNCPRLNADSLLFLLDSYDPNLLSNMLISQDKYTASINILKNRNKFHDEMQKQAVSGNIDKRIFHIVRDLTDSLYDNVDMAIDDLFMIFDKFLNNFILKIFPHKKPIYLDKEDMKKNGYL